MHSQCTTQTFQLRNISFLEKQKKMLVKHSSFLYSLLICAIHFRDLGLKHGKKNIL